MDQSDISYIHIRLGDSRVYASTVTDCGVWGDLLFLFVSVYLLLFFFFFFQAEDGIRDYKVTGVQTCALPILVKVTPLLLSRPYDEGLFMAIAAGDVFGGLFVFGAVALTFALFSGSFAIREIGRASCRERV